MTREEARKIRQESVRIAFAAKMENAARRKTRALELHAQGWQSYRIAQEMGLHITTIRTYIAEWRRSQ